MRIAGIIKNSVVNGIGIRDTIFLQGCEHHCVGCHNPKTWKLDGGKEQNIFQLYDEIKDTNNDITISGGEPLLQYNEVLRFMVYVHKMCDKRFWLYTGFKYEEIPPEMLYSLSKFTDVLVDGRFEIDKKDLTLAFRGSSNQRLIDLPKSVQANKIILWEDIQ